MLQLPFEPMARLAPFLAAALLLPAAAALPRRSRAPPQPKKLFAGGRVSPPHEAPAISLRDASGAPVTLAGQRGRYVLVTFLYTHCPDVCPLIASNLNGAVRALGARGKNVRVLAISVDPKGDTPAAVRAYVKRMQPRAAVPLSDRVPRRAQARLGGLARAEREAVSRRDRPHRLHGARRSRQARSVCSTARPFTHAMCVHDLRVLMHDAERCRLPTEVARASERSMISRLRARPTCRRTDDRTCRARPRARPARAARACGAEEERELVCHREHLLLRIGNPGASRRRGDKARRAAFVATLGCQVALRDPRRSTMRCRRQLRERVLGLVSASSASSRRSCSSSARPSTRRALPISSIMSSRSPMISSA